MAPHSSSDTCATQDKLAPDDTSIPKPTEKAKFTRQIVWFNVFYMITLHLVGFYGGFLVPQLKFLTVLWIVACYMAGGIGITAGAHRLWSHRCYKAKWQLRLLLMLGNSMAAQNDIFQWVRDHRVHHKYTETDADPHNAKRGLFFSHIGWILQRKHPDVISKGKGIDLSDLYADEIVMFQRRHYNKIAMMMNVIIPTLVPYLWGESLWNSYFTAYAMRYVLTLNSTWCVNSFAHLYGDRPYDKNINPAENYFVIFCAWGEGFHNYHHTFPQDYAASEFGTRFNISTKFINFFAAIGWAYDRKVISQEAIRTRMTRTGVLQHLKEDDS